MKSPEKAQRRYNPVTRKKYIYAWRQHRIDNGICIECKEKVALNLRGRPSVFCEIHREKHAAEALANRWAKKGKPRQFFDLNTFMSIPVIDLSYVAGLLDGEGHLKVAKRGVWHSPYIALGMTDPEPVRFVASLFGGSVRRYHSKRENRKPAYQWARCGRQAAAIARAIEPYLRIPQKKMWAGFMSRYGETMGHTNHWRVNQHKEMQCKRETMLTEFLAELRDRVRPGSAFEISREVA